MVNRWNFFCAAWVLFLIWNRVPQRVEQKYFCAAISLKLPAQLLLREMYKKSTSTYRVTIYEWSRGWRKLQSSAKSKRVKDYCAVLSVMRESDRWEFLFFFFFFFSCPIENDQAINCKNSKEILLLSAEDTISGSIEALVRFRYRRIRYIPKVVKCIVYGITDIRVISSPFRANCSKRNLSITTHLHPDVENK